MIDPRQKKPTGQDLLDTRHQQWLYTLKTAKKKRNLQVIPIDNYFGKTAKELTERELEVLQLISFGRSTQEIADIVFLSEHTVKNHRKKMLERSNCGNMSELVRVAINENLL